MSPKWIGALALALLIGSQALAVESAELQVRSLKPGAVVTVDRLLPDGKVMVSVADARHNPILGLGPADFTLTQAGRTATIVSVQPFEQNIDIPRHIVLVLDNSYSMLERKAVKPLRSGVEELLKIVRPIDQVSLVVFDDKKTVPMGGRNLHVRLFQSSDPAALRDFVAQAYSSDGLTNTTVLYEGMLAGLELIDRMPKDDPRFMVVFSDGQDLNSAFKPQEVTRVAQGVPPFGAYAIDYMPGEGLDPVLSAFAAEHRGQAWKAREETNLMPIFQEVASRLLHHYLISYVFAPTGVLTVVPASLTVEEIKTIDASPMLGHIYFEEGSATIPERYIRFSDPGQTASFAEAELRGTLDKYYQVLNLVGKRLTEHPDATVTLVGCNANTGGEKGNKQLSGQRAEAVRAYLQSIWNIAPERMAVETRNLPEMPSTSRLEEGRAENRRVEIRSTHPAILDLVRSTYLSTDIDARSLTARPTIDTAYGIARWRLTASAGGESLAELVGEGEPAAQLTLPLRLADLKALAAAGSISVDMELADRKGQTLKLAATPLPVRFIETKERLARKEGYRVQEKYALILFDFDSAAIGARNQAIVDEIAKRIRELPEASVTIVGHTDTIGTDEYNLKLSERRGKSVYDQLLTRIGEESAGRITHRGVGEADPLFDNLSPEARAFNRTVTITLEYMARE
jgi:outer membrane protein OmpA-like peptidoglycan-associated protein